MLEHLNALYDVDTRGRAIAVNQFDGGRVPRLHLARTPVANYWRIRADVPDNIAEKLTELCEREPPLGVPDVRPVHDAEFRAVLETLSPIERDWLGPAFAFPAALPEAGGEIVHIDEANAHYLEARMSDWLPDVAHRRPFVASVVEGEAVAVCASARMRPTAHEAGVETVPEFRRQGHALNVVITWALGVRVLGAEPRYSTSWENIGSQAVTRRLGLKFLGADNWLD